MVQGGMMGLFKTIKSIGKEHWITAIWFLVYSIILGSGPILLNLIIGSFIKPFDLYSLIDSGQLIVLSAALVSSGVYFVGRDFKRTVFPGRLGFLAILIILWMLVCAIFTCITLFGLTNFSGLTIYWEKIRIWNYVVSVVSLIVVYVAAAINEWRTQLQYKLPWDSGTGKLENDFDKMVG